MNQIYVDGFSQWRSLEMIEILFSNDRFGFNSYNKDNLERFAFCQDKFPKY